MAGRLCVCVCVVSTVGPHFIKYSLIILMRKQCKACKVQNNPRKNHYNKKCSVKVFRKRYYCRTITRLLVWFQTESWQVVFLCIFSLDIYSLLHSASLHGASLLDLDTNKAEASNIRKYIYKCYKERQQLEDRLPFQDLRNCCTTLQP